MVFHTCALHRDPMSWEANPTQCRLMWAKCTSSALVSKEGGGTLCSLDCDPLSRSVSAQRTNEPLGQERSILCWLGMKAVPGISPLLLCVMCHMSCVISHGSWVLYYVLSRLWRLHNCVTRSPHCIKLSRGMRKLGNSIVIKAQQITLGRNISIYT